MAFEPSNRKLIRPSLTDVKEPKESAPRKTQPKKPIPPDQTNAENFYYIKQMQSKTPMVDRPEGWRGTQWLHRVV